MAIQNLKVDSIPVTVIYPDGFDYNTQSHHAVMDIKLSLPIAQVFSAIINWQTWLYQTIMNELGKRGLTGIKNLKIYAKDDYTIRMEYDNDVVPLLVWLAIIVGIAVIAYLILQIVVEIKGGIQTFPGTLLVLAVLFGAAGFIIYELKKK